MGDKEILEIQNLGEDDLLTLEKMVEEHIKYLEGSILDNTIVESEGENHE
jgi:hypothetical protein